MSAGVTIITFGVTIITFGITIIGAIIIIIGAIIITAENTEHDFPFESCSKTN